MQSQSQGAHAPIRHNSCHATQAAVPHEEVQGRSWVGTAAGSPATLCLTLCKMGYATAICSTSAHDQVAA